MPPDELNAPLGQDKDKQKPARTRAFGAPQVLAALLALSGLVIAGWAAFVNDPLGGEPKAVIATKAAAPVKAGAADGDRDCLLTDVGMQEAGKVAGTEALLYLLLEAADQEHLTKEADELLPGQTRLVRCHIVVVDCHGTSAPIAPRSMGARVRIRSRAASI